MVFQKPNPFPKSIYENVAYGLRLQGVKKRRVLDEAVERAIKRAALWDEVKDRLNDGAMTLSGGQQQRLVIARAIAIEPEVLLLDEPASALDPISTLKIEDLIYELKTEYTILIVTHNMQQAARVSDHTAFMYLGDLIEFDETKVLFTKPKRRFRLTDRAAGERSIGDSVRNTARSETPSGRARPPDRKTAPSRFRRPSRPRGLPERAAQRPSSADPRRATPSRGACPPELGPIAHKTAGSGFERRTPARRAKAREGFRKRVFQYRNTVPTAAAP